MAAVNHHNHTSFINCQVHPTRLEVLASEECQVYTVERSLNMTLDLVVTFIKGMEVKKFGW